mmetsp:Transcript_16910/g.31635  ORF Transcript_16910/g.31635 Transcript_16910/m.31635 type:complete len:316 (-) Transcript_16910:486-1433(-)
MTNIAIHHTEEEWESGSSEQRRVRLTIPRNTICVDKLLVTVGKLVGGEVRWGGWPRFGNLVNETGHGHVHVGMSTVDTVTARFNGISNNPALASQHTRDVSLEHVERMIDCLLAKDNPRPPFAVLGEHLAQAKASVLILEQHSTGVNELLGVLREHAVNRRGIIHVRKRIPVSTKGVTDVLELLFNRHRLVEDDEHTLLHKVTILGVSDGLLDGSKADIAVATSGAEDHALEPNLLFRGDDSCDRGETHVHVPTRGTTLRFEEVISPVIASLAASSGELRNSKTRGISHKEPSSLLENLLQLHLLIVLRRKLLAV